MKNPKFPHAQTKTIVPFTHYTHIGRLPLIKRQIASANFTHFEAYKDYVMANNPHPVGSIEWNNFEAFRQSSSELRKYGPWPDLQLIPKTDVGVIDVPIYVDSVLFDVEQVAVYIGTGYIPS